MALPINEEIKIDTNFYKVENLINLTTDTFIISFPKSRFSFEVGQHISLSVKGDYQSREYSIYNGESDPDLQVLVKEVPDGHISPKLKNLNPGDLVEVFGPFGKFGLDKKKKDSHMHVFIASGTGIAPFHSIVRSYPDLNYKMIHGVRFKNEAYGRDSYDSAKYKLCTSRDKSGDFKARVTHYLKKTRFDKNTVFYLCGNSNMIFDVMEILKGKGFDRENINVEVYF